MQYSQVPLQTANDIIDSIAKARQTARLRFHLLSLEARQRWSNVEAQLDTVQSRLEREGEGAVASLGHKIQEVRDVLRHVLSETRGSLSARATDLMRPAKTCAPNQSLADAAQLMWEQDCGFAPVCDREGKLLGVITDRDICMAAHLRGQLINTIPISTVMTQTVATVTPETPLMDVLRLMQSQQVKRIPVVRNDQLTGVVTLADVTQHLDVSEDSAEAAIALARTLTAISTPRHDVAARAAE
jgi:CBS domain-containing protein